MNYKENPPQMQNDSKCGKKVSARRMIEKINKNKKDYIGRVIKAVIKLMIEVAIILPIYIIIDVILGFLF